VCGWQFSVKDSPALFVRLHYNKQVINDLLPQATMASLADISKLLDDKLKPIHHRLDVIEARQVNATRSREDPLVKVPLLAGTLPPDADHPTCLAQLLVAGNESLPNGQLNGWNMKKSKRLLKQYSIGALSDSDGEDNEHSQRNRNRRLALARFLGITAAQLNFVQLTL